MASLRFGVTNLLATATLQNGTGGGAPALDEVSPWLTSNVKNADRGLVWQGTATGNVDLTLASASTLAMFAVLGHRGAPSSSAGVASVEVFTQAGAYTPGGTWTSRGTITLGAGVRDGGFIITPVASLDSVRFTVTATTAFTIGRLWAGAVDYDLSVVSSPGYQRRRVIPQLRSVMGGGTPHLTTAGDVRWEYVLPYQDIGAELNTKLRTIGSQGGSFVLVDRDGTFYEAVTADGTFSEALTFDAPDTFTSELRLETIG